MSHHRESDWLTMALGVCVINDRLMKFYDAEDGVCETKYLAEFLRAFKDARAGESSWLTTRKWFTTYNSHVFVLKMLDDEYQSIVGAIEAFLLNTTKERAYELMMDVFSPLCAKFNSKSHQEAMRRF
jgi:hypothetical protein